MRSSGKDSGSGGQPKKVEGAESSRRTLELLEAVGQPGPPKSLEQLASAVGLAKSTAYRLLRLLQEMDYVERGPAGGYMYGRRFITVLQRAIPELDICEVVRPILQDFADRTEETVTMHRRAGDQTILMVGAEGGNHMLRYVFQIGDTKPLIYGCRGRSILAFLSDTQVDRILAGEARSATAGLKRELAQVRKNGYAVSAGRGVPGLCAVAAPIFEADGKTPIMSLVLSGPCSRLTPTRMKGYAATLRQEARQLGQLVAEVSAMQRHHQS